MIDLTSSPEPCVASSRLPRQLQSLQSAISSLSLDSNIEHKSPEKSRTCRLLEPRKRKNPVKLNSASADRKESNFHPLRELDAGIDVRDERKITTAKNNPKSSSAPKDIVRRHDEDHHISDYDDDFEEEVKLTKKESRKKASALHTIKKSEVCEMGIVVDSTYIYSDDGAALKEILLEKNLAYFEATCEVKGLIRW